MKRGSEPTVGFGAPDKQGAHVFAVQIDAAKSYPVKIIEDFGLQPGGIRTTYATRVILRREAWTEICSTAAEDFNKRLKLAKVATGRWKSSVTLVERLLGKELCVLAWAAEQSEPRELQTVCNKWSALRPEERWWLYSITVAEAGNAEDSNRGWRKAIYYGLSDGAK